MTVLEILQKTDRYFQEKGVDASRLSAELLLCEALKCKRLDLYLNFDKPMLTPEVNAYRELVKKRASRIPIQYILGSAPFMDFEVTVRPGCLIPRPETACLLEAIFSEEGDLSHQAFLDLGTGSGIIAIALKRRYPEAVVVAVDKQQEALSVAEANGRTLCSSPPEFILSDLFSALQNRTFDWIVSNPPYIESAIVLELEPEVKDHEPRMALDGGVDGLNFYRPFFKEAAAYLKAGGHLVIEHGDAQGDALCALAESNGWTRTRVLSDLAGKERGAMFKLV